jgi:hypothetical protein
MAKHFFAAITRNKLSLAGTAIVTASITLMGALIAIQLMGLRAGAYMGILTFLILPMCMLVGLVMIPVGIRQARKEAVATHGEPRFPKLDLNDERTRKTLVFFLGFTIVNTVILAAATYKGVEVMDSTAFCGTVCHTVMQPEHTAHQRSPHARVACADCHIGPGADWFVKSKLSGAWQVIAVSLNLYPKPIPTPIENLRPARDTCEQCHWPTTHIGDTLKVKTVFKDDEENTPLQTAVLLKVGGLAGRESHGIHWHVNPAIRIRYLADEKREKIYDVELTDPDGTVKLFQTMAAPEEVIARGWRTMDCIDCHNRPTHRYQMPMDEVDNAMAKGYIDATLPYIKRESMRVLRTAYATHVEAKEKIPDLVRAFYADKYPEIAAQKAEAINEAVEELVEIYTSNVFPEMAVDWGTYGAATTANTRPRMERRSPGTAPCATRSWPRRRRIRRS